MSARTRLPASFCSPVGLGLLRLIAAFGFLLASAACERVVSVEPGGSATVLVGVVVAGADSVFVRAGRIEDGTERHPEPGAHLTVDVDGLSVVLEEGPAGSCGVPDPFSCYRGHLPARPETGSRVVLEGELASGRPVWGEALVPPPPPVTAEGAGPGDTVRAGPVRMARVQLLGLLDAPFRVTVADTAVTATVWAGTEALACDVRLPGPPPDRDLRRVLGAALSSHPPRCPDPEMAWDSMAVPVTLLGYDASFTAWSAAPFQPQAGTTTYGLDGAQGVLGAASPRSFVLVVTP